LDECFNPDNALDPSSAFKKALDQSDFNGYVSNGFKLIKRSWKERTWC
jgi:hypothetical protein